MNQEQTTRLATLIEGTKSAELRQYSGILDNIRATLNQAFGDDWENLGKRELNKRVSQLNQKIYAQLTAYFADLQERIVLLAHMDANLSAPVTLEQTTAAVNAALFGFVGLGALTIRQVLKRNARGEAERIANAVKYYARIGRKTDEIKKAILGTKSLRYKDGILNRSKKSTEATINTSISLGGIAGRIEGMRRAGVKKIRWVSVLDSKTTDICRSLDGRIFDIDAGEYPPAHYNCRSTVMDASLPFRRMTYYEWLKMKPLKLQEQILGKERAKIFNAASMTAERFSKLNLDKYFNQVTLEDFKRLAPKAYAEAVEDGMPDVATNKQILDSLSRWSANNKMIDYAEMVKFIGKDKIKQLADKYGLSEPEIVALRLYTMDGYKSLNKSLREDSWDLDLYLNDVQKVIASGLDKLPDYRGEAYRMLTTDFKNFGDYLKQYEVGKTIKFKGFLSTSKNKNFIKYGVEGNAPAVYTILSKAGKSILDFSEYNIPGDEDEVLFKNGTSFVIKDINHLDNGTYHITMEEQ